MSDIKQPPNTNLQSTLGVWTRCPHCGLEARAMTDEQYTQHWDGKCPKAAPRS
jgi:bacterioferritin-associated ferredoxin